MYTVCCFWSQKAEEEAARIAKTREAAASKAATRAIAEEQAAREKAREKARQEAAVEKKAREREKAKGKVKNKKVNDAENARLAESAKRAADEPPQARSSPKRRVFHASVSSAQTAADLAALEGRSGEEGPPVLTQLESEHRQLAHMLKEKRQRQEIEEMKQQLQPQQQLSAYHVPSLSQVPSAAHLQVMQQQHLFPPQQQTQQQTQQQWTPLQTPLQQGHGGPGAIATPRSNEDEEKKTNYEPETLTCAALAFQGASPTSKVSLLCNGGSFGTRDLYLAASDMLQRSKKKD